MEKEIDTLIIYTIVKTPGCGAEPHIMALERAGRGVQGTSGGKNQLKMMRRLSLDQFLIYELLGRIDSHLPVNLLSKVRDIE